MEQDPHQEQNEIDFILDYDKHMATLERLEQQFNEQQNNAQTDALQQIDSNLLPEPQQELLNMQTSQTIPSIETQMSDQREKTINTLLIENLSADQ